MSLLIQIAQNRICVLAIAAATDILIGDPPSMWHPVRGIGAVIGLGEKTFRRIFDVSCPKKNENPGSCPKTGTRTITDKESLMIKNRERAAGILTVLFVLLISVGTAGILLTLCGLIHPWLKIAAEGLLCGRFLALRSLGEAGFSVRNPLREGKIEEARLAVSMIVGRDTERLDEEGIAKAAVETVAENTSDGVTAPLFYMILFGGIGGTFYKAVNTMDSMLGYRNERYRYFGTAAARLDDVMNYVPSRLTALLMIAACFLPGREYAGPYFIPDGAAAFHVWRRDRLKSPSPNSAQTESVCAGALHLRLLGDTWYFGELHHKKQIGDGGRRAEAEDITRAVRLMNRSAAMLFVIGILCMGSIAFRS